MLRWGLVLAVCGVGSSALAADGLEKWKLSAIEVEAPLFNAVTAGDLGVVSGSDTLKALPKEARVAVVNTAGAVAKAFVKSDTFKSRYAEWRAASIPDLPRPARSRAQLLKEVKAEVAQQRKDFEESIKAIPKEQAANIQTMRQQFEASIKMQLEYAGGPGAEAQDKLRYDEDMRSWNEANVRNPKDPQVRVKGLLEQFLDQTKDVEFDAALKPDRTFKKDEHEAKSAMWKAAYRAGPEATKAARAFALQWLKELK